LPVASREDLGLGPAGRAAGGASRIGEASAWDRVAGRTGRWAYGDSRWTAVRRAAGHAASACHVRVRQPPDRDLSRRAGTGPSPSRRMNEWKSRAERIRPTGNCREAGGEAARAGLTAADRLGEGAGRGFGHRRTGGYGWRRPPPRVEDHTRRRQPRETHGGGERPSRSARWGRGLR